MIFTVLVASAGIYFGCKWFKVALRSFVVDTFFDFLFFEFFSLGHFSWLGKVGLVRLKNIFLSKTH